MTQSVGQPEMTAEDVCDFLNPPEWLVRFHTGYEIDATDWADVSALCIRFGIPVPPEYSRFTDAK